MTRVKICGIRRLQDAMVAADAGADLLGFVFAESRRRIAPEVASDIIAEVKRHYPVQAVGVFVNAPAAAMDELAGACGLDYLQLSGQEDTATLAAVGRPVIKALHVASDSTPEELASRAVALEAEIIMLDTGGRGLYGGTGETFDWGLVPPLARPLLLAGGLTPDNVASAIRAVKPWGVDVSSGVETNGEKDQTKIRRFLQAARGACTSST